MKISLSITAAASALILGLASAQAADPVTQPDLAYDWTGLYVGVHAGIGGGTFDHEFSRPDDPLQELAAIRITEGITAFGAFGGAQIGYNYRFGPNWLVGAEADFSISGIRARDSQSTDLDSGGDTYEREVETRIDWFGTLRGRLGYAMDNFLIYGTGGAAYGRIETSASERGTDGFGADGYSNSFSFSDTKVGWTAGAGFEYGLTEKITVKTEYLYVDLGSIDTSGFNEVHSAVGRTSVDTAIHTLKAGLNYRF